MVADLNVHWDRGADDLPKPHAHVMLTMRSIDEDGFGKKVRDWNSTGMVERWRESWATLVNERLAELDIDARIDHRSLEYQGIALEPQSRIGAPAQRIVGEGSPAERAELHREIARDNGARIAALPPASLEVVKQIGLQVEATVLGHMGEQHHELRTFAGRKMAALNVDLGNQREQIRELLARIDQKDGEIAEIESEKHDLEGHLDLARAEILSLKESIAKLLREEDFQTRMLAVMKETLGQQAKATAD